MAEQRPVVTHGLRLLVQAMKQRYHAEERVIAGMGHSPEATMLRASHDAWWRELMAFETFVEQLEALGTAP